MKKLIIASIALVAVAGAAHAESRALRGFDRVNVADRINTVVAQGETFAVRVEGRDARKVRTVVADGELRIRQTNRPWFGSPPRLNATVHVTMPRIEGLSSTRGASLTAENIRAGDMGLAAAMGGEITVSGTCGSLNASASMGGSLDARALECSTANVAASMGGDARVFASSTMDGSASMGGSITNDGAGRRGSSTTSMGGSITRH